jgi:antitoxin component HigA of HigAB toxin-antitoxin module
MNLKPIKTEVDYKSALNRIEEIIDTPIGSSASDEMDI